MVMHGQPTDSKIINKYLTQAAAIRHNWAAPDRCGWGAGHVSWQQQRAVTTDRREGGPSVPAPPPSAGCSLGPLAGLRPHPALHAPPWHERPAPPQPPSPPAPPATFGTAARGCTTRIWTRPGRANCPPWHRSTAMLQQHTSRRVLLRQTHSVWDTRGVVTTRLRFFKGTFKWKVFERAAALH